MKPFLRSTETIDWESPGIEAPRAFAIRQCEGADAEPLSVLATRLFRQAYGATHPESELNSYLAHVFAPKRVAEELANRGTCVWVAEDGSKDAIGYVWLQDDLPPPAAKLAAFRPLHLRRIFVDEAWHGLGVAQALLAVCVADAEGRNADALWLAVWQEAARPIAFYRKAGFDVVGTTTFTFGNHVDADFIMARPVP